jgi:hypothetical protein
MRYFGLIKAGLAISILSWLPLLVVGALDPTANPIGLGLLAWVGNVLGIAIAAFGLIRLASGKALRP